MTALLELLTRYQQTEAEYNACPIEETDKVEQLQEAHSAVMEEIKSTSLVAISPVDALAALRQVRTELGVFNDGHLAGIFLHAGLSYFDKVEAMTGEALADAVRMSADLDVSKVDGHGWAAIYEALTLAINGMGGIVCQPRCQADGDVLNPAGEYIDAVLGFLMYERRRVVAAAKASVPKDSRDWDAISTVVLQHEIEDGDLSMVQVAALAIEMQAKYPTVTKG